VTKTEFTVDNWHIKQTVFKLGCPFLYKRGPAFILSRNETLRVNFIDKYPRHLKGGKNLIHQD